MEKLISSFEETFGNGRDISVYSAPGRVEIGGNHTDHQRGCVLAAAVNLDMRAAVSKNGTDVINIKSEGYREFSISLSDLSPKEEEKNHTKALVRGVARGLSDRGGKLSGVDMYITSNVLRGSGLSSSAAFEVLIGTALNDMFSVGLTAPEIAKVAQFAETVFFGKPCGLMDQMASSVGGIVAIDFESDNPKIERIECDLEKYGYDLAIIDAGADHADLTEEYASIPRDMKKIAGYFGKNVLREVSREEFLSELPSIREKAGDRAILRAMHYFNDSDRAVREAECLRRGDFDGFLELVRESGRSSFMYLQNIYVSGSVENQAMAYAICVCEELLGGHGACRIQGGGFGGTIEAFVPKTMTESLRCGISRILGENMCHILTIRNDGGIKIR